MPSSTVMGAGRVSWPGKAALCIQANDGRLLWLTQSTILFFLWAALLARTPPRVAAGAEAPLSSNNYIAALAAAASFALKFAAQGQAVQALVETAAQV
jgi:hypothetical protein